jgi:hypothetical protein
LPFAKKGVTLPLRIILKARYGKRRQGINSDDETVLRFEGETS